ncbi:MAG: hypothetical protein M0Z73_09215 [Betaproteobacteria bacterium]|nr:hypothetical protein [Betaproteobacteria bacterium]
MKNKQGLLFVFLRICGFLAVVALSALQTACSNQESETAKLIQTVNLGKPPMAVAWRPDGKQFAAVGFGNLGVWDAATGKQVPTPTMWAIESSVVYSPDGRLLVLHKAMEGHQGMSALVWLDAKDQHVISEYFDEYPSVIHGTAFSPDSRFLVVGANKKADYVATVFDTAEKKPVAKLVPATPKGWSGESINCIIFSPDGSMVIVGGLSGAVNVWSTRDWQIIKTFKAHKSSIRSMAISPNGKWLATGSESGGVRGHYDPTTGTTTETKLDDPIKIWDTTTWEQVKALPVRDQPTSSLAFLPDGKHLVSANADRIVFWDVQTEKQVGIIKGNFKGGSALNFALSQDGKYLVVGGMGSLEVQLWKITGQLNN